MIKVAIVCHPDRYRESIHLLHSLFLQGFAVNDIEVCCDGEGIGAKANHLRAWEWLGAQEGTQYGLVLEDDVVLCADFRANLEQALRHAPTTVLSLYLGRGRPPQYQERIATAITRDTSYLTTDALLSAQGYCMPTSYFNKKVREQIGAAPLPIDEAISQWVQSWHGKVAYPKYSLVDHLDGPTLIDDHGDGAPRNGTTALVLPDCDPSGAKLQEVRKAWLMAGHNTAWDLGSIPLPQGDTP